MFETLPESCAPGHTRRGSSVALLSITLHASVIGGALWATHRRDAVAAPRVVLTPWPAYRPPTARSPDPIIPRPIDGGAEIVIPRIPPLTIPPIDGGQSPIPPGWIPSPGGTAGPTGDPGPGGRYVGPLVEELPELLAAPLPAYPERLRQARIEGLVVLEVIVDTTGKVEPASIRVIQSAHPGFVEPARIYLRDALFRPGRVSGRAVRVLVRVPIAFRLRR